MLKMREMASKCVSHTKQPAYMFSKHCVFVLPFCALDQRSQFVFLWNWVVSGWSAWEWVKHHWEDDSYPMTNRNQEMGSNKVQILHHCFFCVAFSNHIVLVQWQLLHFFLDVLHLNIYFFANLLTLHQLPANFSTFYSLHFQNKFVLYFSNIPRWWHRCIE